MSEMHQHVQKTTLLDGGGLISPRMIFFRDFCKEKIFYSLLLCIDHRNVSLQTCQSAAFSFPPSGSSSYVY